MSNYYNKQWRLPNNENKDKQSNYSMDFDSASSQFIDLGTTLDPYYKYVSTVSFSVWVNFKDLSTDVTVLGTWRTSNHMLDIRFLQSTGKLSFRVGFGADTGGEVEVISSGKIVANTWYHLAMVYDGTQTGNADRLKAYINGSQETLTFTGVIPSTTSTLLVRRFEIGGNYLNKDGLKLLDGVAIYNYALSSSQVTTLYGSSSTGIGNPMSLSPAPVAYYPLGDQDAFNGAEYLTPNASLKDYVFSGYPGGPKLINSNINQSNTGGKFTISLWQKYNGSGFATFNHGGSIVGEFKYFSKPIVYLASSYYQYFDIAVSDLTANTDWQHWVIFVDTTDVTNSKFWVDGVSIALAGNGTTPPANAFTSGLQINLALYPFISNMMYFTNYEINQANVNVLYNNGAPITSTSGLSTAPDHWYKFNSSDTYDGTNWTITDHAGSSNGTSSGMTQSALQQSDLSFKTSYSPYALDFDGTNDYIDLGTYSQGTGLALNADMSISAWIKTSNLSSTQVVICNLTSGATSGGYCIEMNRQANGQYGILYDGATVGLQGSTILSSNTWYHIVMTRTGTSGNWSYNLYLNGNADGSATNVAQNFGNGSVAIGRFGAYNGGYFNGYISNVSIWNSALTSSQVSEIYNQGVPSNLNNHSAYSNLVSWWQLGSNSSFNTNWTVLDEKGSNDGTSVNMDEVDIVDGVGSYANGLSSGMGGDEVIGDAPYSSSNSLSVNMDVLDRTDDTPN